MRRIIDLFSGACGGFSLGFERAGWQTVAACEIDDWRRAAYGSNFPHVKLYKDVRDLTAAQLRDDGIERIEALVGGFPCQDASNANSKGKGVDGPRTGLAFEFCRLAGELRPDWIVAENVPAIRARGVDRVLAALEGEGYTVWPLVVGARHIGAPHKRDRVWIVAHAKQKRVEAGQHLHRRQPDVERDCLARAAGEQVGRTGQPRQEAVGVSADAASDGRRPGRAWRPDPSCSGQRKQPLQDAPDAEGIARRRGPDESQPEPQGGTVADADSIGIRHPEEPRWPLPSVAQDYPSNPDRSRLEERQGERGDAREEQPSPLGAILAGWNHWNGGFDPARLLDDGVRTKLAPGEARRILAAYGDAVIPTITEAIGRAILSAARP